MNFPSSLMQVPTHCPRGLKITVGNIIYVGEKHIEVSSTISSIMSMNKLTPHIIISNTVVTIGQVLGVCTWIGIKWVARQRSTSVLCWIVTSMDQHIVPFHGSAVTSLAAPDTFFIFWCLLFCIARILEKREIAANPCLHSNSYVTTLEWCVMHRSCNTTFKQKILIIPYTVVTSEFFVGA